MECESFEDRVDDLADDGDSSPSPSEDNKYEFSMAEMSYDNDTGTLKCGLLGDQPV